MKRIGSRHIIKYLRQNMRKGFPSDSGNDGLFFLLLFIRHKNLYSSFTVRVSRTKFDPRSHEFVISDEPEADEMRSEAYDVSTDVIHFEFNSASNKFWYVPYRSTRPKT
jgi:hypothetical protein